MHHSRMMMIFRESEIITLCSKQTQRHFWSVLFCSKKTLFRAYCMPMYACQLWSKHTQSSMKRLRAAYNNAYRIMHHIPRNVTVRPHRSTIVSGHLMLCWETTCMDFLYDAHFHSTFLFVRFKCVMRSTNLHFSLIIQSSCMMETNCSSCWCIVSVFACRQYCFCVVNRKNVCAMYTNQPYKKHEVLLKCFAPLSVGWSCANTDSVMQ